MVKLVNAENVDGICVKQNTAVHFYFSSTTFNRTSVACCFIHTPFCERFDTLCICVCFPPLSCVCVVMIYVSALVNSSRHCAFNAGLFVGPVVELKS